MLLRLLWESFARQRRRKALAAVAVMLGTTAVAAMLALATSIGDRIHRELSVYGANIIVTAKGADLKVKVGGVMLNASHRGTYLRESDLEKLKTIFWANNITGLSPELDLNLRVVSNRPGQARNVSAAGLWFEHPLGNGGLRTGAPVLHPLWKLAGEWPSRSQEAVLGSRLARQLQAKAGDTLLFRGDDERTLPYSSIVTGVVDTGTPVDDEVLLPLATAQRILGIPDVISRVDVSARTRPEDAFARLDPDTLPAKQHDLWYCRPYANSIAYQIREAIPGAQAEQVRRVEQTEGTLLSRISGLMWLVSSAALLAAGFAVSAAMATAVMERRGEIALMRSLGAGEGTIALLFYAESGILAVVAGVLGYLAGSGLAWWLGRRIFAGEGQIFNPVLLPVVVALAVFVAFAGSTPAIRSSVKSNVSNALRGDL